MKVPPVICTEHDLEMERREDILGWACPADGCTAWIGDEDVYRLLAAAKTDPPMIGVT